MAVKGRFAIGIEDKPQLIGREFHILREGLPQESMAGCKKMPISFKMKTSQPVSFLAIQQGQILGEPFRRNNRVKPCQMDIHGIPGQTQVSFDRRAS